MLSFAFDRVSVTQENADKFPIVMIITWYERKDSIPNFISFLVDSVKDLDFRRIILKCENEPSMKVFRKVLSHHTVRETKRRYRILGISEELDNHIGFSFVSQSCISLCSSIHEQAEN